MARRTRCSDAGYVYHVLNRAVGRATIFEKAADYAAFKRILAQEILRGRIYLFCPNSPAGPHRPDRLRGSARQAGSIPRENTVRNHFLTLCRYAERNPLLANLVTRAEHWRCSKFKAACEWINLVRFA